MNDHHEQAIQLLRDHYDSVGVVFEDHITEDTLYTVTQEDTVIGAAVAEHLDHVTMVHQLAVHPDHRRNGIANTLINQIIRDTHNTLLEAKTHVGSDANDFFDATGWQHVRGTNDGHMNVWHREL